MALTGAFYTALSGLNANGQSIDVIGNNIANVNTPGFKASRSLFTTQFLANFSTGSPPSGTSGGTNPNQVGLGTRVAGTQVNFANGGIQSTGITTNMAIEGSGFFIVNEGGSQFYTRDGQFALNSRNELVTANGAIVQGYGVDSNFNIQPTILQNINIALGTLPIAQATQNVTFAGNLNANGDLSTGGSQHTSRAFFTTALLTGGTEAVGTEDLTTGAVDLYIDDGSGGSDLAIEGGTDAIITVTGVEKNGAVIADRSFAFSTSTPALLGVDAVGTTLNDFMAFLQDVLGLDSTSILGEDLGGSVTLSTGQIVITGNEGTAQDLDISTSNFIASNLVGGIAQPMVMTSVRNADGESEQIPFTIYDSLGTPVDVNVTFVKQNIDPVNGGTIWEWVAESDNNASLPRVLGLGIVTFDANGQFVTASNSSFSIDRDNGSVTPLTVNLEFGNGDFVTASFSSTTSQVFTVDQDGFAMGTLNSFSVGENGVITGNFTNGESRSVGQIALATFINNNGLVAIGNNLFSSGPNSGNAIIGEPLQFGAGRVLSGALEQSNVDLAEEFVRLITASTGFSAASRVITTSDEMIQQLLLIGR